MTRRQERGCRATVRDLIRAKREQIRKNRDDFMKKLGEAPRAVQGEYHRCCDQIDRLFRKRKPNSKVEATLYPAAGKPARLSGIQVAWLLDLLSHPANNWDVRLSKPLGDADDSHLKILFRFDPHED